MQDFEKLGAFYLGRVYDPAARQTTTNPLLYDSKDLVTHAVCVGMTGSGKTGLCIDLLEEAAIDGIPAIVIDPKGDIVNLLLQFPELRSSDFAPWVNPEDARQQGITTEEFAEKQAELWRSGLEKWGQTPDRIRMLQRSADFTIYTPGSNAGMPLSILKSFAPPVAGLDDAEAFRDSVSGTASAVLSLLSIDAEPLKSREHILLSHIFSAAWEAKNELSLEELIHQIQSPAVTKIGVMDLEAFYPAKDRFALAMALNNLLASPGFATWLQGEPLDISKLLYTPEGTPRVSILSIAHLSDSERMFLVTLVLNEVLTWSRRQAGTSSLRAILYMDEIFGYFPPSANPPSKRPLLTLLKQARAYGVGVVLATQNPVDLDYKGLANAGTWLIGRLQTDRDKQRLLDGLEGAAGTTGASFDRAALEQTLAGLGKRVFLMNNVHEDAPVCFESRWAMSYLRGPLTRQEITTLTASRKAVAPEAGVVTSPKAVKQPGSEKASQRPILPPGIASSYLPCRGDLHSIVYHPMLLASVQTRYADAKTGVDQLQESTFLTPITNDSLPVQWEECQTIEVDPSELEAEPTAGASYGELPAPASNAKSYQKWQKDLTQWIYSQSTLKVFKSTGSKSFSQPGETEADFRLRLQQSTREQRDAAVERLRQKYSPKIAVLQDRLRKSQQAIQREKEQSQSQTMDTVVSIGASVLGAFFGRRKLATAATGALRSAGRVRKESSDVNRAEENADALAQQVDDLQSQLESEIQGVQAQFDAGLLPLETVEIRPKKTNIHVRLFTLVWAPYREVAGSLAPAYE